MKVGFLGGSFDPVHLGHLQLARAAFRQLKLDRIFFVPARRSPFKQKGAAAVPAIRLTLLRKAIQVKDLPSEGHFSGACILGEVRRKGDPGRKSGAWAPGKSDFRVLPWELSRSGPSYTITTLRRYQRDHPSHRLFFILGSDALSGFERWRAPREILQRCTLVVGRRPGALRVRRPWGKTVAVLKGRFPDISSTDLRRDLAEGKSTAGRLPLEIADEIRRRKWYASFRNENN